ncbi:MAG: hypothetical protein AAF466_11280, partial [Bacteroidota bacterium]
KKGRIDNFSELDKDLANQIQSISLVASRKYSLFSIAVWITATAYLTFPVAVIFWLYNFRK